MTAIFFTFLVLNINTKEQPIYKATCINGCGHGYGKTIDEAVNECRKQVGNLIDICNEINLPIELKSKEEWLKEYKIDLTDTLEDKSIHWVTLDYDTIMKQE